MCRHSVHAMAYMGKSEDNVWKPVFSFYQEGLWDELKSSVKEASAFIHWAILPAHLHLFFYFTLKENPVHSNNRQMLTSGLWVGWKSKDAKIQRAASFTVVITLWMLKKAKIHQTTCLKHVQIITGQLYPSKAVKQLAKDSIYKDQ